MNTLKIETGFTLIEILIVVTIIVILATIAIPSYNQYISKAQQSACILEVKGYSNQVFYILNSEDSSVLPNAPTVSACDSITDATSWTLVTQQKIIAIAKAPSNARIECDIPKGTPCVVLP